MKISFCTTCMGRTHHLRETLLRNIRDNHLPDGPQVEFVVLDYNSKDGMGDWILNDPELQPYLESGVLQYFRTEDPEHFHMAHAKNMAHRLASGDVLCNLDADNFLGYGFSQYLDCIFTNNPNVVLNPSQRVSKMFGPDDRGFFGRVAVARTNFERLQGYDEQFKGWGFEDTDFMQRAKGLGLQHLRIDNLKYLEIITHSNHDRVVNMVDEQDVTAEAERIDNLKHHTSFAMKFFRKMGVLARPIQVNGDGHYGEGTLTNVHGREFTLGAKPTRKILPFNIVAQGLPELIRGRLAPRIAPALNLGMNDNHAVAALDKTG